MKFEDIKNCNASKEYGHVHFEKNFSCFINDFNVVGVKWNEPIKISANYFLRLLIEGSSARARGYGKNKIEHDESSNQLSAFYLGLLDHGALWKLKNGQVICTCMPYGDEDSIEDKFNAMVTRFRFPKTIKMQMLDNKYRFRENGDCMIVIYNDFSECECYEEKSYEDLRENAIKHSSPGILRYHKSTKIYERDQVVSKYTKIRAKGICQLCGLPAPFQDKENNPFLEVHHIIPLSEGGADSIENTVALCPNCHRKMHVLKLDEDIEKLIGIVAEDY